MILCCGEALIDMLPRQTSDCEDAFAPYAGGAVFNTAIALGRLDAPVGFFSGISDDMFGQILSKGLAESQVNSAYCAYSDRPTTLAFVTLVDGQARYAFYDEGTAGRLLSQSDIPQDLSGIKALFFGGISLISEPCALVYEAFLLQVEADHVIMIDPNIRPGFIADAPRYRTRLYRMVAKSDIVKLSDEYLTWLSGSNDMAANVDQLLAQGAKLVFITEGAKGAWGFTQNHRVFVAATPVKVADTVGAGDTFNAGILAALHRADALHKTTIADLDEHTITAALCLGAQAAAITVSRPGANPPWAKEITASAL